MGQVGEIFALAGLHIDKGSFSEYGSALKSAENQVGDFSTGTQAALASAFALPAAALTGIASYGATIASSYEDATLTLKTLYGSQEAAQEKFEWLADFAATTPFEFPELMDSAIRLKAFGMDIEQYGRTLGDTAAAMGKPVMAVVEAIADAQQGEFERMKEFGIKAVEIQKNNYQQLGASMQDVGKTALTYMDANGKQQIAVVDRNNKEMITSTIEAIWNDKYAGAMEERSKSFTGMLSNIQDSLKTGLAELAGFDLGTATIETWSLLGVLKELAGVGVVVADAFAGMSEPMQTFVIVSATGVAAVGLLAAGLVVYTSAAAAYSAITGIMVTSTLTLGAAISAAIWPATLVVGTLALVAAGLVYLNEKTGVITYSWNLLKDIFTIVAHDVKTAFTILWEGIVYVAGEIRKAIESILPMEFLGKVGDFVDGVVSQFSKMGVGFHEQAEEIRNDSGQVTRSFEDFANIDTSGTQSGIENISSGISSMIPTVSAGTDELTTMGNVDMGGTVGQVQTVDASLNAASATGTNFTHIISDAGNVRMDGTNAQISLVDQNGKTTSLTINQLTQYLQESGNVSQAGTAGQLALVDQNGKVVNLTADQMITLLQTAGNQPLAGTRAGLIGVKGDADQAKVSVNGLGQAITRINMTQPKWNSVEDFYNDPTYAGKRAPSNLKMGITSSGGTGGTGEGNVKIVSTTNKNTINNNGDKLSASKAKAAGA
ncbi:MAG: tape measure protein [Proteiniphilum sp.]|nr:tape measure protein [Proteiniphilum sp.]